MDLRGTGSRMRCLQRAWVFLGLTILGELGARAQEDTLLPIHLGRVVFSPSMGYSFGVEDNVERTNADYPLLPPLSSPIQDFRPTFRFEFPFERSDMTLSYSARMRQYGSPELSGASGTNHYLDFAGRVQVTPSLRLDVEEHYLKGISEIQELQNLSPGLVNEVRFSTRPYEDNRALAWLTLSLGAVQSLEVGGVVDATRIMEMDVFGTSFDTSSRDLFARYLVSTGPDFQLYGTTEYQSVSQTRLNLPISPSDYRTRSVGAGFRRQKEQGLTSDLQVSYAVTDFPNGGGVPYSGISVEGDLGRRVGVAGLLGLKLHQGPYTSFFNTNAFYVNQTIGIAYREDIGSRFRVSLAGSLQDNQYPEPVRVHVSGPDEEQFPHDENGVLLAYAYLLPSDGMKRKDRIHSGSVKLLWHLGRPLNLELGYRQDSARSNIIAEMRQDPADPNSPMVRFRIFDYDSSIWTATLIFGWQ